MLETGSESGAEDADTDGCLVGTLECRDQVPYRCMGGVWAPESPCEGRSPICSEGVCVRVFAAGGWATVQQPGARGSVRLVEHGFTPAVVRCADVSGNEVCVAGGIRP